MDSLEKLTIDTPEQIAIEFPLAGIGSRFLAVMFDMLVQFIIYFVLFLLSALVLGRELERYWPRAWNWSAAVFVLISFCLYWGYYALFETIWNGQTPGKRHAGIRVIKDTGQSISAFEAIGRNLVRVVDQFPGVYAVGVLTMFLNHKSKRLGDFVAGTVVVHEKKEDAAFFNTKEGEPVGTYPVTKLTMDDLELMEAFLARRLDLSLEVRKATAQRITDHVISKMQCERKDPDNENLLEAVTRQCRDSFRYR